MKLIATRSLKYATRRLQAGDEFEAKDKDVRILVGARLAHRAPEQATPEPPKPVARIVESDEEEGAKIARLRAEAEQIGIDVDGRWGAARLQQEIMQAKR